MQSQRVGRFVARLLFCEMRLDVFLKLSRLMPRRSLAQELCDAGLIEVNGAVAKSSKEVKAGDTISINRKNRTTKVRIDSIPERKQVAKAAASDLFTLISDEQVESA